MGVISRAMCSQVIIAASVVVILYFVGDTRADIMFDFVDADRNGIIFNGENVTLRCKTTRPTPNVSMKIILGHDIKADNNASGNIVEYIIHDVAEGHTGHYTCTVTYEPVGGSRVTDSANLQLEVHTTRPQCKFNGTTAMELYVGDSLLFSCFCLLDDECHWRRYDTSENTADNIGIEERIIYGNKSITRLLRGPLIISDNNLKMECFLESSSDESCVIGPVTVNERPTTSTPKAERRNYTALIVCLLILFVLIVCVIIFLYFFSRRWRRRRLMTHRPIRDVADDDDGAYATVDFSIKNRQSVCAGSSRQDEIPSGSTTSEKNIYVQRSSGGEDPIQEESAGGSDPAEPSAGQKMLVEKENPYMVPNAHFEAKPDPPPDFKKKRRLPHIPSFRRPPRDGLAVKK